MSRFVYTGREEMNLQELSADSPIAVVGLGYVGCVTAACLAYQGFRVTGVDKDEYKVAAVNGGAAPFYEPGLEDLIRQSTAAQRLSASTDIEPAIADADIALICVGTPSEKNGNLNLGQLRRVTEEIAHAANRRPKPLVVAVRSTVFPGTCEEVVIPCFQDCPVSVVSNPEFLREGCAVKDFIEPSLIVIGGDDLAAKQKIADLYAGLGLEPCLVSLRTAEMIKFACNAFHATKISFANEIGALAQSLGIPADEVMDTLCRDEKLNVSSAYLKPGFAFGGSCLPKDLRALVYRAARNDLNVPLLESVLPSNRRHLERAVQSILDLPPGPIGVYGLSFKENTDDLRESPVVSLIETLLGKGRQVRVYDPHIQLDSIYGSNRNFLLLAIPHISKLLCKDLDELLQWAEFLVLTQKPGAEADARIADADVKIIDVTRFNFASQPQTLNLTSL
jgi:GDP-mannose 6-dehydrogenase